MNPFKHVLPKKSLALATLLAGSVTLAHGQSFGVGGGGFGGGSIGGSSVGPSSIGGIGSTGLGGSVSGARGASAISDGMGGFTTYSQQGTSRYIGESQSGRVYHPDGSSSQVIEDSAGDLIISGPQGNQRVFRNPLPDTWDSQR